MFPICSFIFICHIFKKCLTPALLFTAHGPLNNEPYLAKPKILKMIIRVMWIKL